MHPINPVRAGLVFSAVLALWHLAWATLVGLGWAQAVLDFILRLHFIDLDLKIAPFNLGTAAALVAVTGLIGFAVGAILAIVWNQIHPAEPGLAKA